MPIVSFVRMNFVLLCSTEIVENEKEEEKNIKKKHKQSNVTQHLFTLHATHMVVYVHISRMPSKVKSFSGVGMTHINTNIDIQILLLTRCKFNDCGASGTFSFSFFTCTSLHSAKLTTTISFNFVELLAVDSVGIFLCSN